jgi:uncharacterized protein YjbI with pentapeptide repeats
MRVFAALIAVGVLLFVLRDLIRPLLLYSTGPVVGIVAAVAAIVVLIRVGQHYEWTGFGESSHPKSDSQEVQPGKTLWDWLQLFIVPLALALIAVWWTTAQENVRQQEIEARRAQAEQVLAAQQAQDEALRAYLDQMSQLLLEQDLRSSAEGSSVRALAQARTVTVFGSLGPDRKRTVIEFLYEASLINGDNPVIPLNNANLSGIDLSSRYLKDRRITGDPNLEGINLRGADLSEADLLSANLTKADLSGADLSEADLRWAYLYDAKLFRADLREADLSGANINNGLPPDDLVYVSNVDTSVVSLQGADLTQADLSGADLSGADLSGADLSGADLSGAEQLLSGADLSGVDLSNADLRSALLPPRGLPDVDLSGADLTGADTLFITPKKLAQQAKSLKGATMPNGQKYEDWLKSKDREVGGKNDGSS